MPDLDAQIRLLVFKWLEEQCQLHGETLPLELLKKGVPYQDTVIRLIGPQGIFKPAVLPEIPLSITTSPNSPYSDEYAQDGYLHYSYRGTDPAHRDNVGLRLAMQRKTPLVYFFGVVPGKYLPVWPVYIVGDYPEALMFTVALDEKNAPQIGGSPASGITREIGPDDVQRRYLTVQTKYRLHQQKFRERVLQAYHEQCAMCKLRHPELLEAVHIIPDAEPEGEPRISNGIALCNLHHAAFDRFVLGIRPDYIIEVRKDILEEEDGPVLQHALKGLNEQKLILPASTSHYPNSQHLEVRYSRFKRIVISKN